MPDWFDQFAAQPNKTTGDWFSQFALGAARTTGVGAHTWEGVKAAVETVNPLPMLKAANTSVAEALQTTLSGDPVGAVKGLAEDVGGVAQGIGAENQRLYDEAREAFAQGDVMTGITKAAKYVLNGIPGLGSTLDQATQDLHEGEIGRGIGRSVGLGASLGVPVAAKRVGNIRLPAPAQNTNAAERAAVAFGQREGIPIDAATATGNRFIRNTQAMTDRSPLGSVVAERAEQTSADAFRQVGERLAGRTNPSRGGGPGPAVSPEQAGQGVRDAVQTRVRDFHAQATTAYDKLRAIEADPANLRTITTQQPGRVAGGGSITVPVTEQMALPVDMRPVKTALRPIFDRLNRQLPLTIKRSSPGFTAIENIINGKDFAPLSVADADLGAIKAIGRGADLPELRDASQGLAAAAVKSLDEAVRATALSAGRPAFDALLEGRRATVAKHAAGDLLRRLREEPVQVFNQATWQKDAGIERLREIAQHAPAEMPKLGRAYLDDLLGTATAEGSFGRTQGIWQKWQNLGPETKKLLFRNSSLIKDLDHFFLLAKKAAESPNPSGTALTAASWATGVGLIITSPTTGIPLVLSSGAVSKLLRSPRVVKALTHGMQVKLGNKAAATAAASEILTLARQQGVRALPLAAEDREGEAATPAR